MASLVILILARVAATMIVLNLILLIGFHSVGS